MLVLVANKLGQNTLLDWLRPIVNNLIGYYILGFDASNLIGTILINVWSHSMVKLLPFFGLFVMHMKLNCIVLPSCRIIGATRIMDVGPS